MSYIKAEDVLPEALIVEIQRYVDGRSIYIPRKPGKRRAWGMGTDYRSELGQRNSMIRADFTQGAGIDVLCEKYHLSEKSIRRILRTE